MNDPNPSARAKLKARLLALLQVGAGSLVVASTVMAAPRPTPIAPAPGDSPLKRAEEVRAQLVQSLPEAERAADEPLELAWWGNRWPNFGWRPWANWPNGWRNWNNWPNWGNVRRGR